MPNIVPPKNAHNAWSVADFESHRAHLTLFVREKVVKWQDDPECRRMLIHAPVKSGKREMVEYIAVRDISPHPRRIHVLISAWHRMADEEQRSELSIHNVNVYSITNNSRLAECIRFIQTKIRDGLQITVHIDECDFGSGSRQTLGQLYQQFRENPECFFILYSATPQEVLFSGELDEAHDELYDELIEETRHGVCVDYDPPFGYCGPKKFLLEGLVQEAMPFFKKIETEFGYQNKEIRSFNLSEMLYNTIRLKTSWCFAFQVAMVKRKEDKHIYQFLRGIDGCNQLDGIFIIAAKGDLAGNFGRVNFKRIEWSKPDFWTLIAVGIPII